MTLPRESTSVAGEPELDCQKNSAAAGFVAGFALTTLQTGFGTAGAIVADLVVASLPAVEARMFGQNYCWPLETAAWA